MPRKAVILFLLLIPFCITAQKNAVKKDSLLNVPVAIAASGGESATQIVYLCEGKTSNNCFSRRGDTLYRFMDTLVTVYRYNNRIFLNSLLSRGAERPVRPGYYGQVNGNGFYTAYYPFGSSRLQLTLYFNCPVHFMSLEDYEKKQQNTDVEEIKKEIRDK